MARVCLQVHTNRVLAAHVWPWNRICAPCVLRGQELGQGVRERFPPAAQKLLQPGGAGESAHTAAEGQVRGTGSTVCGRMVALFRL